MTYRLYHNDMIIVLVTIMATALITVTTTPEAILIRGCIWLCPILLLYLWAQGAQGAQGVRVQFLQAMTFGVRCPVLGRYASAKSLRLRF